MSEPAKLTKKQLKAQQFRKTKEEKEVESQKRALEPETSSTTTNADGSTEPVKKKRKTRRGRKGKGRNGKSANRFIIFVGSLPKDITQTELQAHFKTSSPDSIRVRGDKGIAFLEFDGDKDGKHIQSRMDTALLQNKTEIRGKRINVELTVGGGGNSENRLSKLKTKNEKFEQEYNSRMEKMIKDGAQKKRAAAENAAANGETDDSKTNAPRPAVAGMHPDRAKMFR
ncbi:similar to Saccharomyces cerevisiae YDL213C NOP6 rRNA-binding protein required for 40S ribosomal subunit biogenesis [Maudiozyma barnettii]|uniref:Similar to Saccharomyces cerevisiae YDL213C NOP6 rRNA-binding protein required for 40S ribosomal subunit biogenesis n=1 Tax=Maudiozyma barnettii TaxID=61262 RepID=A0A8H2ZIW3_9SACH|nr:Nop6p [Kazachstania barnettii]CAB4255932.1 similar to Saccharomyces cerevisiae YDL213C NOP6 rRNA-binding protein required for 40S ribosomal subunit biogenesis [Kazachstania barnettii]CAD1784492.1 similar to Saccharomyces cerevisiae YDL213C NOP6 rRNA-binding protein required for 40S ribosomal subunit biogenesis [Kazachstania barnettii]